MEGDAGGDEQSGQHPTLPRRKTLPEPNLQLALGATTASGQAYEHDVLESQPPAVDGNSMGELEA